MIHIFASFDQVEVTRYRVSYWVVQFRFSPMYSAYCSEMASRRWSTSLRNSRRLERWNLRASMPPPWGSSSDSWTDESEAEKQNIGCCKTMHISKLNSRQKLMCHTHKILTNLLTPFVHIKNMMGCFLSTTTSWLLVTSPDTKKH